MRRGITYRSSIRRFFKHGFHAADIAQYLISYDASRSSELVRERMEELGVDIAAIRDDGFVVGFVRREEITDGRVSRVIRPCDEVPILHSDAPLRDAIRLVAKHGFVFVTTLGDVGGLITRDDLQKPPVRMWLFGLITVLERAFAQMIKSRYPGDTWRSRISPGRHELAIKLLDERRRRNEDPDLVDCLQFSDKALIVFKDEEARVRLDIPSMSVAKETIKLLERLRNSLAHSQKIVGESWPMALGLAARVNDVLELYDGEGGPSA